MDIKPPQDAPPTPEELARAQARAGATVPPVAYQGPTGTSPAPPPPRRSGTGWWLLTGLGLTMVLAGAGGFVSWDVLTGGIRHSVEQQQTWTHAVSAVTVRGGAGDVAVRGGAPTGSVVVTRTLNWGPGSAQPSSRETWSNDALEIVPDCPSGLAWCSVDYVVQVPERTRVTIDNGSGDVTVGGALGALTLKAGSGDIEGTQLDTDSVVSESGSGDTDLQFAVAPNGVTVDSGSGDVTVDVPSGSTYATQVDTGSGSERVAISTDPSSARSIRVKTGSGDVDLGYR